MTEITYLDHSGFVVTLPDVIMVFDYYRDPAHALHKILEKKAELPVIFFVSHHHHDHYNTGIFEIAQNHERTYVLSNDILAEKVPSNQRKTSTTLAPTLLKNSSSAQRRFIARSLISPVKPAVIKVTGRNRQRTSLSPCGNDRKHQTSTVMAFVTTGDAKHSRVGSRYFILPVNNPAHRTAVSWRGSVACAWRQRGCQRRAKTAARRRIAGDRR